MTKVRRFSGDKIRQARHEKGYTQAEFARVVGTRERNIVRWENNQHEPRLENVIAIAAATSRDVDSFLEDEEDGEADSDAMMRAAYELDRAGQYALADDLRKRARRRVVGLVRS